MQVCRRAPRVHSFPRPQRISRPCSVAQRAFTTSTTRQARKDEHDDGEDPDAPIVLDLKKLKAAFAESATPEGLQQLDELAKENGYNTIDEYLEATLERTPGWASEDRALADELMKDDRGEKPNKQSFWFDEEDPDTNTEEHDEFDEDDITSMAHGKLDEVRDMRQYARLAVWEMPLLSSKSSLLQ